MSVEVDVKGPEGKTTGKLKLDAHIFEAEVNEPVMHQALIRQLANNRQGTASTKTRTEVRGGGRKPYRQKGTGRARQGSTRAPQWTGGGVVFGPTPRSYAQDMPKKQRRLALRSALSAKRAEERMVVVESLDMDAPSTRGFVNILADLGIEGTVLVVLENHNVNAEKSSRNLVGVRSILGRNLNVRDLLNHDWLVITRAAVEQLGEVLA
ncbi:MAG: large subunit ribosomal protein [Chloroflexota bacterium]|jgi:large subunit ribosomal protein L4|nr:large subunit ribosomal protein [Chloroflexota bacterium]